MQSWASFQRVMPSLWRFICEELLYHSPHFVLCYWFNKWDSRKNVREIPFIHIFWILSAKGFHGNSPSKNCRFSQISVSPWWNNQPALVSMLVPPTFHIAKFNSFFTKVFRGTQTFCPQFGLQLLPRWEEAGFCCPKNVLGLCLDEITFPDQTFNFCL